MKHEVRDIPPAPRRVRLLPLLAHRWPLGALGVVPTVLGALIAWAMFLQSGGKFSLGPTLDQGPVERTTGIVRSVAPPVTIDGQKWQDVRYDTAWQGSRLVGGCFVPAGSCRPGDQVAVEILLADVNLHRIVGGLLHIDRRWLHARFWLVLMVVPGGLLLLGWLRSLLQLRHVLVHGLVAPGFVHRVTSVRFVLPEMLRVDYTFRDHRARSCHGCHWVRRHGELGRRLDAQRENGRFEELPVLHDRRVPQWSRMLLPGDFLHAEPIELPPLGPAT